MARVTVSEVKEIIDTTIDTYRIAACITAADLLVDEMPSGQSTAKLKEIARWLAAHLVAIQDPRELRAKIGDAEAWFAPNVTTAFGMGLRFTPYGQQVLVLDTSGYLANLGMRKAVFRVSKDPPEES